MTLNPRVFSLFLLYLLPISLITGPAIPDISITLIGILFLINIFIKKDFDFIREFWVKTGLLFWIILLILSFFSKNIFQSFIESFIFLRYLLLIIAIIYVLTLYRRVRNFQDIKLMEPEIKYNVQGVLVLRSILVTFVSVAVIILISINIFS